MGMFDSIGSGLGSITKALDVGGVAKGVIDGVLPKNMAFVGDLAGALVDFKTGNLAAGLQHAMEALHDLPQSARGSQQPGAAANQASNGRLPPARPMLEPSPPPLTSRGGKPFDWNDLLSAIKALTAALNGQAGAQASAGTTAKAAATPATTQAAAAQVSAVSGNAGMAPVPRSAAPAAPAVTSTPAPAVATTTAARATSTPAAAPTTSSWRGHPAEAPAARPRSVVELIEAQRSPRGGWRPLPQPAAPPGTPATSTQTTWVGRATTPALSTANHAATAPATAASTPSTAATADHPAAASTTAASSTTEKPATKPAPAESTSAKSSADKDKDKGKTITSASQLQGMSDAAFMDAISNGRISPDVAKDPAAMMAIQQRMNDITQMNNLMTAMMRAIHDMKMAIIQNIRI